MIDAQSAFLATFRSAAIFTVFLEFLVVQDWRSLWKRKDAEVVVAYVRVVAADGRPWIQTKILA